MSQAELALRPAGGNAASPARLTPTGRHPLPLFLNELRLVFGRTRNQVLLVVLGLVPVGIGLALRFMAPGGDSGNGDSSGVGSFIAQVTHNGLFLVFTGLLVTMPFFLPMVLGVVAGDSVAGEANMGTLRYLLVAPAGRTRLLAAKAVSLVVFCVAATFTVALTGLLTGLALFPIGPVPLLSGDTISMPAALGRAALVALVVAASMLGLAAMGLFVSTLTSTPLAAMAVTVGVAITAQILDTISQLHAVHPYLFLHYWMSFADLLRQPVYLHDIGRNLLMQLAYVSVFGSAAWARLTVRDISA